MTPPLVSCVVPVFNAEPYLKQALDSILAQTHRPIEVIVADDGSTDGSADIVAAYAPSLVHVTQATAGPPATRNLGLRTAQGQFVAFLDPDDLWHPEKLARQLARFEQRPELDYCLTFVQRFWGDEMGAERELFAEHPRGQPIPGYATPTLLARREAFEVVGEFDTTRWSTDSAEWFMRAAERGLVMEMLPDVLVYRREHAGNLSRRLDPQFRAEWLGLLKAKLDRERGHNADQRRP